MRVLVVLAVAGCNSLYALDETVLADDALYFTGLSSVVGRYQE